jgi:DNA end-binding protein Ku
MGENVRWNFGLSHTYRVTDDSARARPTRLLRWDSVPAHGLYAGRQGDCEPCHDRSGKVQSVFGLVTIPVNLYSAIERRETLSFNLLHKKDHARTQNKRFCSEEGVEVPWSDVVKGYEYAKGQYVVVTDEDFEKARVPATQTFDIRAFVAAGEVADLYFDEPYYLEPNGKAGAKAYALLRDALKGTGRIGVGTVILRQREHVAAVEPSGDALVLSMMRFAHEIRSPNDLDLPKAGEGWTKKEMGLAHRLIDTLADKWKPEEFREPTPKSCVRRSRRRWRARSSSCPPRNARAQSPILWRR